MKFTAQEEYGLRCILSLARTSGSAGCPDGGAPAGGAREQAAAPRVAHAEAADVTVAEIAALEGISIQYAGKLFRILGKSGLLESVRGRKGGYRLSRPATAITVAEILAALGGTIYSEVTCERYVGDRDSCVHTTDCSIRSLWSGLQHLVDEVLSRLTLAELIGNEQHTAQWIQVRSQDIAILPRLQPRNAPERTSVGAHGLRGAASTEATRAP